MKCYCVARLDVTDPAWVEAYVAHVTPMVERYGGRYLSRTSRIEKLEGDRELPQLVLLLEWPSRDAAVAFYESDEYRPFRDDRIQGSRGELLLVPGEDVTGTANVPG